jgi:hypothetical protein
MFCPSDNPYALSFSIFPWVIFSLSAIYEYGKDRRNEELELSSEGGAPKIL